MSRELHGVALRGYGMPMEEVQVSALNDALDSTSLNGSILEHLARQLPEFRRFFHPTTTDGYTWFWAAEFVTQNVHVVICIPWKQDWDRRDDSQLDRSAAVYVRLHRSVPFAQSVVDALVAKILEQAEEDRKRRAKRPMAES